MNYHLAMTIDVLMVVHALISVVLTLVNVRRDILGHFARISLIPVIQTHAKIAESAQLLDRTIIVSVSAIQRAEIVSCYHVTFINAKMAGSVYFLGIIFVIVTVPLDTVAYIVKMRASKSSLTTKK